MTVKEYLSQAYMLDRRINSDIAELTELRHFSQSIRSSALSEKVTCSHSGDAPFVKVVERLDRLEKKIDAEIDIYVNLKEEIREVISAVENSSEQMVLRYRYIQNYTWERIGNELNADSRTIRRWHSKALTHVILPKNPIKI